MGLSCDLVLSVSILILLLAFPLLFFCSYSDIDLEHSFVVLDWIQTLLKEVYRRTFNTPGALQKRPEAAPQAT